MCVVVAAVVLLVVLVVLVQQAAAAAAATAESTPPLHTTNLNLRVCAPRVAYKNPDTKHPGGATQVS